ncbi:hypothetical protein TeGR_g4381 [Tetraparma gracilis]|uniref:AD domain-containing protein n=1 Tax=Tetraparma gracilis TaxID=2962635 RepID=A0ABQ6MG21_9STRA|nr:hypothetical protein TeGR_g4381 [Tetraparma gracilis]
MAAPSDPTLQPLHLLYPVGAPAIIVYPPALSSPPYPGSIYATDAVSNSVTLTSPLGHTVLAVSGRTLHLARVSSKFVRAGGGPLDASKVRAAQVTLLVDLRGVERDGKGVPDEKGLVGNFPEALRGMTLKSLEERERHQRKVSFDRIRECNPSATKEGQACFVRLLKACGDVRWTSKDLLGKSAGKRVNILIDESILVLPPYDPGSAHVVGGERMDEVEREKKEENLGRVQKIVAAVEGA